MNKTPPWWQNGVIYQIYPKSFQDTTGSGTGDLAGVIQRLDYLKMLGVDAIWLTPFYISPQVDNGYDVANYTAIDPAFGTMSDFDHLVEQAHKRGLRVILDMVFNHSSTQHHWFHESLNPESPYRDYYIWRDGTPTEPPNNWKSKFGGSAWRWHPESNQYYMHLWAPEQADLNWENDNVRAELKQIVNFWADRGIDGLRLDVVNLVSKHQDFPDDPDGDGLRLYTDGPRIHEYMREMSRDVFRPRELMTVGEMSSATLEHCQQYGSLAGDELSMVFSFDHVEVDFRNGQKWTLTPLDLVAQKKIFTHWQQGMYNRAWNALFWCNHDQPRVVSRWGDDGEYRVASAKMLALVLHGMQGTPYIYQGEELGMTNPGFTRIIDYRDIESHNMYAELRTQGRDSENLLAILASKSRDNGRTPMQWDASENAGFTDGTPWIGMSRNYETINAEAAVADPDSIFYTYQKLIQLRKRYPILTWGDYLDLLPAHAYLWCYRRQHEGETLIVVANFSRDAQAWHPEEPFGEEWEVLMSNYSDAKPAPGEMMLRPWEAVWWYQKKNH
ncbi:alpha,alpha-phosphotrehalase [Mixta tenebrionis]|mgnify:FL=1|uniref:Alpha,alpha-phosphotrehalase n=1 Tax=Mixta tenebrionis TaxID=2562439 RepID=A0A506VEW7_9GAMM|nr:MULTISPECIES: alpha,alpha-phosphotrehalase [Mixta]QHM76962.1 Trehalose-6-phosphate hydrolase [Mixta theicola]TPW43630.1 alpha,alpha-phosphotrehalase [Mixta tenebrionis]